MPSFFVVAHRRHNEQLPKQASLPESTIRPQPSVRHIRTHSTTDHVRNGLHELEEECLLPSVVYLPK